MALIPHRTSLPIHSGHLEYHGAVECYRIGQAVKNMVHLASKTAILVDVAHELPGVAAVRRELVVKDHLIHCRRHLHENGRRKTAAGESVKLIDARWEKDIQPPVNL